MTGVEEFVRKDKILIISALDGTFERKPFGQIPNLIPLCDDIVKLNAICMVCGNDAPFTHRLGKFLIMLIVSISLIKRSGISGMERSIRTSLQEMLHSSY